MKRYIRSSNASNNEVMQLSDLLSQVDMRVVIVDDFSLFNRGAIECSEIENYNEYSDAELAQLNQSEVSQIKDIQILMRIGKLNRKLLTPAQKLLVIKEYEKKVIVAESTVKYILNDLKQKSYVSFMPYKENEGFMKKYGITPDDALYAIQHLTVGDYVNNTKNKIPTYYGDELIIFEPTRSLPLKNGNRLTGVIIYIKVDLDLSNGDGVYLISFHDTDREDNKPYKK